MCQPIIMLIRAVIVTKSGFLRIRGLTLVLFFNNKIHVVSKAAQARHVQKPCEVTCVILRIHVGVLYNTYQCRALYSCKTYNFLLRANIRSNRLEMQALCRLDVLAD